MRISYWSSDVCSSDLRSNLRHRQALEQKHHPFWTLLSIGSMPPVETAVAGHEPIEHRFNETLDRQWFLKAHRLGVRTRIIGQHSVRRCADFESTLAGFVIFNGAEPHFRHQIVRASCRESVCQSV